MLIELWHIYLYQPLFNGLIWIYNNWTDQNLGWAIVYLTIILRVALLPLTIINEINKKRNADLNEEIRRIDKELANDEVLKKEEIRKLLKKRHVQPWAKIVSLGIQLLVLILLYEVFIGGIEGQKMLKYLYDSIQFPGTINTEFYGFELGERHTFFWPFIVAVFLMIESYIDAKTHKTNFTKADLSYLILFPLAVFVALWWLPMVKSLFVLTSIIFSAIIGVLLSPFGKGKK